MSYFSNYLFLANFAIKNFSMGLFNKNKEKNMCTADAIWPYNIDIVAKAVVAIGANGNKNLNGTYTFYTATFEAGDIVINLIPISNNSTRIIVQASSHIGAMNFAGLNLEALGNRMALDKIMKKIATNLR